MEELIKWDFSEAIKVENDILLKFPNSNLSFTHSPSELSSVNEENRPSTTDILNKITKGKQLQVFTNKPRASSLAALPASKLRPIEFDALKGQEKERGYYSEYIAAESQDESNSTNNKNEPLTPKKLPSIVSGSTSLAGVKEVSFDKNQITSQLQTQSAAQPKHNVVPKEELTLLGKLKISDLLKNEPKVMVPFNTEPGKTPRKIKIERKKRLFLNQNIEELLKNENVFQESNDKIFQNHLPLELFDDTTYDPRTPEEWLAFRTQDGVAAKGFYKSGTIEKWSSCRMFDYNERSNKYLVEWDDSKQRDWISRINLLFMTEDPFIFAKRVGAAHSLRRVAEALMRYNLYVDSMPLDDQPSIETTQRIMESALGVKKYRFMKKIAELSLQQAISLYGKSTNKLVFDANLRATDSQATGSSARDLFNLSNFQIPCPHEVQWKSTWELIPQEFYGMAQFLDKYKHFKFQSFLPRSEIIDALIKVRTDCNKIANISLFNTSKITKSVRLEEFEQIQVQSFSQEIQVIKDSLFVSLKNGIKVSLEDVGKGWFNLQENRMELYEVSKLKKFMTVVKFMMEDSIRYMIEESLETYAKLIEVSASSIVSVTSTNEVKVTRTKDRKKFPLFMIDLVISNNSITYNTSLSQFDEKLVAIIKQVLGMLQNTPTLERDLMKHLIWTHTPMLSSVHIMEDGIVHVQSRIQAALSDAISPLLKYLETFNIHKEFLEMNTETYLLKFKEVKHSLSEYKDEIVDHLKKQEEIEQSIPENISTGMFFINCSEVRSYLANKRKSLASSILGLLVEKAKQISDKVNKEFSGISRKVTNRVNSVEEQIQQKEYINTITRITVNLKKKVGKMLSFYDLIEEFNFPISNDDFDLKWAVFGWPKKVQGQAEETILQHERNKKKFEKELQASQEAFVMQVSDLAREVSSMSKHKDVHKVDEAMLDIRRLEKLVADSNNKVNLFHSRERFFGFPETEYEEVAKIAREFQPFADLWTTVYEWSQWEKKWQVEPFISIDADQMEKDINTASKKIFKSINAFKESPEVLAIANQTQQQLNDFKPHIPLIQALRNPGMRTRHWTDLSDNLGFKFQPQDSKFTLQDLLKMNLHERFEEIAKIADTAGKEYTIESTLDKMEKEWIDKVFTVVAYKDTGTYILKNPDDIAQLLDDHLVLTGTMSFSVYKKAFETRMAKWESTLSLVADILDAWLMVQKQWLYLEPIFSSDDIHKQMPTEGKRFVTMDRNWRTIMQRAFAVPKVLEFANSKKLLQTFQECNKLLELVQKGLSEYLESKCAAFPRFYFLSNEDLLQILSQSKDPTAVQPHLSKCFENIQKLEFQSDQLITDMYSAEGEKIEFIKKFYPKGNVEHWLSEVESTMKKSIREEILKGIEDYTEETRAEWVLRWSGQVVLCASQVKWTKLVTDSILGGPQAMKDLYQHQLKQLDDLTKLVRGELPFLSRLTLGSLIVMDVHARDVVANLIESNVTSDKEFEWMSQLRYYWEEEDVLVKIVNGVFRYGYEYLGNTTRLVITPLTDRCYTTLTGALHVQLGGAPQGPAGTGKTETTKDLAKALAKKCVVFNCSEGLNYLAMEKFFKGIASSGSWSCFDEFNRIELEVLSVIAQQILSIQRAIQGKLKRFVFEGTEIGLDPTCATFITMNPGYAGRTELPDNLKALFRPVAMMVPDYSMIAEISLFSFGFSNASILARKMVATFKLCSEQLSSQGHYDFGMRSVKTVISAAGNLKRQYQTMREELILLRALRDVNMPKFLSEDIPLFNGIISDLFPGIEEEPLDYAKLIGSLKETCAEMKLQPVDNFIQKCIQLYETIVVRHGVMLLGPAGGGKTTCYRVLARAMTKLAQKNEKGFEKVNVYVMNPKSVTMGQLYGDFVLTTHEFSDGILAKIVRETAYEATPTKKWILLDGPVDANWIENMNTVLDDNKKLCLPQGEIITLSPTQTMMFETEDLLEASPATVSRCGMIYMEPADLGVEPLVFSWLEVMPSVMIPFKSLLQDLFGKFLTVSLKFIRRECKEPVATVDSNLSRSLMNILECFLADYYPDEEAEEEQKVKVSFPENFEIHLEYMFLFSLIWSVGGSTDTEGKKKYDAFLREQVPKADIRASFPEKGSIYDYCYDIKSSKWIGWLDTIPEFSISPTASYSEIIVPTMDTIRYTYLMDLLLKRGKHVLCAGPTGTGKSVSIVEKLTQGMPTEFIPIFINFSAQTKANQIQDILDAKFDKKRKGVVGPPTGRKYTIFIDDVNMPAKERLIGAQPPIELIRQWLDHGGWYDRKLLEFKKIVDINLIAAMGPPGGGRNHISMRFTRHFNLIYFTEIEDISLRKMFGTILDNFLRSFSSDVKQISGKIIEATIEVYNTITNELLPTPSKSHYTFNLRDLSKVFQGMLQVKHIEDIKGFLRLWAHECTRVFSDRLINEEDRYWFRKLLETKMYKYLKITWVDIVPTDSYRLLYGDFGVANSTSKIYQEINPNSIAKVMTDQLEYYNNIAEKPLNLVLFMDAIEHVTRISRIIRQPGGHALLLGIGGSGKQSLTRLSSAMADYSLFQIELSSSYGVNEWREDIKNILMQTGVEEKKIVFLFSDTQIVDKSFLEDINNMLNSGDVPNIFETEDIEKIAEVVGPVVQSLGLNVNKEIIYAHFLKRVKMNLHIVICMSPIGDEFRNRLRMFPSLVNCCTIDWFGAWPKDALISVAQKYLKDLPIEEELRDNLVTMCMYIHQSVELLSTQYKDELNRHNYVTPTSYLELLSVFKELVEKKKTELGTLRKRLQIGLDKLLDTTTEVNHLQTELTANRPLLEQANRDTEVAMEKIKLDKASADETRKVVMKEEAEANKQAEATQAIAEDAKKDLQEALPALESAESALKTLNKKDIFEVKSMVRPPLGVKMVMEAVSIVLAIKPKKIDGEKPGEKVDDYWEIAKSQLLTDPKFLDNLVNLNRDAIPETTIQKLAPYINSNDFRPIAISKVSKACTSLCLWVRAIEKYYHVAKSVAPKREKLKEAQESLEKTMKALEEAKARLKGVEDSIAELERQYQESENKKEELTKKVKDCEEKLDRAHKLISALADEKDRWIEKCAELDKKLHNLVGDAILSAGVISYLGAFTPAYRSSAIRDWHAHLEEFHIPHTSNCNIVSVLGEAVKIRQWNISGLPTDNHSIENAIMVHHSRRWPLMIDPQGQANKWIKKMEQDNGLDVIKLSNPGFVRTLENAIRFGKPVLLENVGEELEPVLDPVLLKQVFKQSGHDVIKIGESVIPYHDAFRFYITTKLPNPNYKPEISTKVSLLNFTLTGFGLEDQLLGLVVEKERPDLEEEKNSLVISNAQMKKEVKDIEDKILVLLATHKGNPLNDETLINLLAESKKTSEQIKKKVVESEEIERKIDVTRSLYRPVAVRACVLFFCIVDLSNIDHMYQYSLNWFLNLFTLGIANAKKSTVLDERLDNLNKYFTHSLFMNVCRSLFENHKLLFSFLLCVKILENMNQMDATEWRYLLAGVAGATKDPVTQPKPALDWVSDKLWSEIFELAKLPAFKNFHNDFVANHSIFKAYFDSSDPHKAPLPDSWQSNLNSFQRLLVLRCIRADKMITAVQDYITEKLGPEFLDPPTFDLSQSFKDSSVTIPLIFVLSPGADPANDFMKFAEEMKFGRKYEMISLGQGQGPKAERMVMDAMERGTWVLLQNCHLAASWMSTLEKIVDAIQPEKVHRDFRLWLTSMPSDKFPVSVLQNSIKMTNEPPKGIKANLMRTYKSFDENTLSIPVKQNEWGRLLFSLAFFHAIVQERRKFGPLGWNVPYEYNTSDFLISMRQLRMFLEEYAEVPYKLLRYLAGELNYGGRVTDAVDRKTLMHILTDFYTEDAVKDEYRFSTSPIYYSPIADSLKSYIKFIKELPINDPPEVFGLHDNAELSVAQQEAFNMFDNILQLQPRVSSNKGNSRDSQIADVAKTILEKLPQKLAFMKVILQESGLADSMTTVVNQEIVRYNRLLAVINRTLNQLLKALKGLVVMSLDLDQLASSLFNNQVPQEWTRSAYPSLKPLSAWVMDLEARLHFISSWARNGVPNVFWISGFFFPQAFLTGTLQNYARKYKISIDTVSFDYEVVNTPVSEITSPPEDGAYISGLFLEGARWDYNTSKLTDSNPKKLYEEMPIIWLKPISNRQKPKGGFYECPMYKTLSRAGTLSTTGHSTNFILSIEIPSDQEQKYWVKKGVALVCSLNY